jgi:hypothetical protein
MKPKLARGLAARAILDFESAVRRERDKMRAEHLENMRVILGEAAEAS